MTLADVSSRPALARFCAVASGVLIVVGSVVALADASGQLAVDEARLTVDGVARVVHPGGDQEEVTGTAVVSHGDVVAASRGTFQLELASGGRLEGRVGADETPTTVRLDATPELLSGDLLVEGRAGEAVAMAGTVARLDDEMATAARLSRTLAVAVGTYHGSLVLESAGQQRPVPALRAMQVAVLGRPPARARPIELDAADPWDQRFLGSAIALTQRLDSLSTAYSATLSPGEGRTAGFYQLVLPDLVREPAFAQPLVDAADARGRGDVLVGAAISSLGSDGSFLDRWVDVFGFRDEGAAWGVVALDQGVEEAPLISDIETAIGLSPFELAQPAFTAPTQTDGTASPPETTAPTSTAPADTSGTTPTSPPPSSPGVTIPPVTVPPSVPGVTLPPLLPDPPTVDVPPTGVSLLDELLDPLEQLVGGLLGGLLGN